MIASVPIPGGHSFVSLYDHVSFEVLVELLGHSSVRTAPRSGMTRFSAVAAASVMVDGRAP